MQGRLINIEGDWHLRTLQVPYHIFKLHSSSLDYLMCRCPPMNTFEVFSRIWDFEEVMVKNNILETQAKIIEPKPL